ncbi:FAD-dependent oxidoreductase [Rhodococcus oxybenzonivorans]|uniref:NAD(P)/FAD-dependent oxidoreductase n=1 Tax=Rhodococcus oxybenzonivorans TaxID=1990687 RepID=UPI0029557D89|nr:FAD-dependent oxidoreductase [Rhodococcus oxybenzonivorans]MDV7353732.1 FAD-dependent oxidoreductase [Rhodococcus oxybenzonivorans]
MSSSVPGHVVVVGASLAGLRAVTTAREKGYTGRITLVGEESHLPYDRPPLSKEYLADGPLTTAHHLPDTDTLGDNLDVDVRTGTRATGIALDEHLLTLADGEIHYDAALIATGVQARTLPGSDHLAGVHTLRTLDDAVSIRAGLDAGARTVVIGAGFIGAEVASAARRRGLPATILEMQNAPLVRAVGSTAGTALAALHSRNGTDLRCGVAVQALLGDRRVEAVRLGDGTEIAADLVVVGIGADPATEWLRSSGLTLDNGVVCDSTLHAGHDVWAAGDVANWTNHMFDRRMRLEHWTNAGEQAAHAMGNLLDPAQATQYRHVPYFWSDWYGQRIQFAGLPIGEPVVVSGHWGGEAFVALYREGERLIGALALNRRGDIMKYRALLARGADWNAALDLASRRNASAPIPA